MFTNGVFANYILYRMHIAFLVQGAISNAYCVPTGRYRLSAEPWLGGDNHLGRLNLWGGAAWLSGLVATLALLPV